MALTPESSTPRDQALGAVLSPTPGRRSVLRAAAWTVPAVTVATAAPAFATSGQTPAQPVTFSSGLFWRPEGTEASADEMGAWNILPASSIVWITQVTNHGPAARDVTLEVAGPPLASGLFPARGFRVLNASANGVDVPVTPTVSIFAHNGSRTSDGRAVVSLPGVPVNTPVTVTVVIEKPESLTRGASPSWNVTVTPPGAAGTIAARITSYAEFVSSVSTPAVP